MMRLRTGYIFLVESVQGSYWLPCTFPDIIALGTDIYLRVSVLFRYP